MKTVKVSLGENSYNVYVGTGMLVSAAELFSLDRRVLIVTDDGVPAQYAEKVAKMSAYPTVVTIKQGEENKVFQTVYALCETMMQNGFTRYDCAVAVGGGIVGDITGFAAACYMRGIDFYNIPTTVLSQVDSSVGGKTGVNLCGIKNIVGAFKQPKAVLADAELTRTLPKRQIACGLAEALKMSLTFDRELYNRFKDGSAQEELEQTVLRCVELKRDVVEKDEREAGLRRVLNFGHTIGHGIESLGLGLYHGECVALGMIPMCSDEIKKELIPILSSLGLPTELDFDADRVISALSHDKKAESGHINAIFCDSVGTFREQKLGANELSPLVYSIKKK